ncbi:MAG TPA: hypothetical protein VNV66_22070 [Pilimelia sp.]|nr:hypothetical protein [Pilimelia sp.]
MTRYTKALAALLGAVGTWGVTAAEDGSIVLGEWFGLLVALGTALGVYALPNVAPGVREPHVSETAPDDGAIAPVEAALLVFILVVVLVVIGVL